VTPFEQVKEFHEKFGHPVGETPQLLDLRQQRFRESLIEEEFEEFKQAWGQGDLLNAFKELADIIYVVEGTAVAMGANLDDVITEVHRSNMTKLGADGKPIYREDGKVLKGPNYEPADVEAAVWGVGYEPLRDFGEDRYWSSEAAIATANFED